MIEGPQACPGADFDRGRWRWPQSRPLKGSKCLERRRDRGPQTALVCWRRIAHWVGQDLPAPGFQHATGLQLVWSSSSCTHSVRESGEGRREQQQRGEHRFVGLAHVQEHALRGRGRRGGVPSAAGEEPGAAAARGSSARGLEPGAPGVGRPPRPLRSRLVAVRAASVIEPEEGASFRFSQGNQRTTKTFVPLYVAWNIHWRLSPHPSPLLTPLLPSSHLALPSVSPSLLPMTHPSLPDTPPLPSTHPTLPGTSPPPLPATHPTLPGTSPTPPQDSPHTPQHLAPTLPATHPTLPRASPPPSPVLTPPSPAPPPPLPCTHPTLPGASPRLFPGGPSSGSGSMSGLKSTARFSRSSIE